MRRDGKAHHSAQEAAKGRLGLCRVRAGLQEKEVWTTALQCG